WPSERRARSSVLRNATLVARAATGDLPRFVFTTSVRLTAPASDEAPGAADALLAGRVARAGPVEGVDHLLQAVRDRSGEVGPLREQRDGDPDEGEDEGIFHERLSVLPAEPVAEPLTTHEARLERDPGLQQPNVQLVDHPLPPLRLMHDRFEAVRARHQTAKAKSCDSPSGGRDPHLLARLPCGGGKGQPTGSRGRRAYRRKSRSNSGHHGGSSPSLPLSQSRPPGSSLRRRTAPARSRGNAHSASSAPSGNRSGAPAQQQTIPTAARTRAVPRPW